MRRKRRCCAAPPLGAQRYFSRATGPSCLANLKLRDRLQRLALAECAQRCGVDIDSLLGDPAVRDAELVDAAPVEPDAVDVARGLPLDDDDIAARGPVEQLPDEIRRSGRLHLEQPAEFAAGDAPVHQRRMQRALGVPQVEKGLAVARGPGGGKSGYEFLHFCVYHRWSPR